LWWGMWGEKDSCLSGVWGTVESLEAAGGGIVSEILIATTGAVPIELEGAQGPAQEGSKKGFNRAFGGGCGQKRGIQKKNGV